VEGGVRSDEISVLREGAASLGEDSVEIVEGLEVAVDDGLVHQWPEVLGGL
jgi:hypothetical protein